MASVSKSVAVKRLERAGLIVDDAYESPIYVDADCGHCGSRFKVGELLVNDGQVDASSLENLLEDYENRS